MPETSPEEVALLMSASARAARTRRHDAHARRAPRAHAATTALVNELYLELLEIRRLGPTGGDPAAEKAEFGEDLAGPNGFDAGGLADIERVLERLGAIDPKLRQVLEMKVFEELTTEEMARQLHCSVRTVARHWSFAQQWLESETSRSWAKVD